MADLKALFLRDPSIVRRCFKKLIVIERDPNAGEPLLGGLVGLRKIVVGRNDWRIVWRVTGDEAGGYLVEVAEVWAVGYRKDGDVYEEVSQRLEAASAAGSTPATVALADVLSLFRNQASGLEAGLEPTEGELTPQWLVDSLVRVVGLRPEEVAALTPAEAGAAWTEYTTGPGR